MRMGRKAYKSVMVSKNQLEIQLSSLPVYHAPVSAKGSRTHLFLTLATLWHVRPYEI